MASKAITNGLRPCYYVNFEDFCNPIKDYKYP